MTNPIALDPPRWKGGPKICPAVNLPAFDSPQAIADFIAKNCPGATLTDQYQCIRCDKWHFEATMRPPSGATSGTGRKL